MGAGVSGAEWWRSAAKGKGGMVTITSSRVKRAVRMVGLSQSDSTSLLIVMSLERNTENLFCGAAALAFEKVWYREIV